MIKYNCIHKVGDIMDETKVYSTVEIQNAIVAEIFPDYEYCKKNDIKDVKMYLKNYVDEYNKKAVSYKRIGVIKVRKEEFPKNTLRKIMRFKLDMTID